jgi:hypothetical protein
VDPIETQISSRWQLRMILVSLGFAVFSAWFAYDGAVAYPAFNRRAVLHNNLQEEGRRDEWLALAKEKGWPVEFEIEDLDQQRRVKLKSQMDLQVQIGLAIFCVVAALALGARVVVNRGRFMILDNEGLVTFEGRCVPLARIVEIDKRRWERKSIAVVHFTDDLGRRRKVVLDDWIHCGMDTILEHLETELAKANPPESQDAAAGPVAEDEA